MIREVDYNTFKQFVHMHSLECDNPYLCPDLILIWLECLGDPATFFALIDDNDRNPSAVPMVRKAYEWQMLPGSDIWRSGILSRQGQEPDYEAYMSYLKNNVHKWSRLIVSNAGRVMCEKITTAAQREKLPTITLPGMRVRVNTAIADFDSFSREEYTKNFIKKLKKRERHFDEAFPKSSFEVYTEASDIKQNIEHVIDISKKSWKARTNEHLGSKKKQAYYRRAWEYFATHHMARIYLLKVNGEPITFMLCFVSNGCFYSVKTGYDDAYKKYYVGGIIHLKALRDILGQSEITKIDWLSDYPGVRLWTKKVEEYRTLKVYNARLMSRVALGCDLIKTRLKKIMS